MGEWVSRGFRGHRAARICSAVLLAVFALMMHSNCGGGCVGITPMTVISSPGPPKHVILFIGDGMGPGQVEAAGFYNSGASGTLSFESFPFRAKAGTLNFCGGVTDSAASATAIATGTRVLNGTISVQLPGPGVPLKTILEYFHDMGRSAGLVTTTTVTHATPAAFGAHESERESSAGIASDYLTQSRPEVVMGGGSISPSDAAAAGYAVVADRAGLLAVNTAAATMLMGLFGSDHLPFEHDGLGALPHLSEMTALALDILDNDPDGFFLMVEAGRIDHAAHDRDLARAVKETVELSRAVSEALIWASGRTDTLIIVTADHDTGGLTVTSGSAVGELPKVRWDADGHSARPVHVYAWGQHSERVRSDMHNAGIFRIIMEGP